MRIIGALVVAALLIWSGYWAYARHMIETQLTAVVASLKGQGAEVSYDTLAVKGYPYRFMIDAQNLSYASPARDLSWQAPELTVHALAYKPQKILVDFHGQQNFEVQGQDLALTMDALRASAETGLAQNLPLYDLRLEGETLLLHSEYGWDLRAAHLLGALRLDPTQTEAGATYDVYLRLRDLILPQSVRSALDASGSLPSGISEVALNGKVVLDAPIDRFSTGFAPQALAIDDVHLQWGNIYLGGSATITPDFRGVLGGEINISLKGWQEALAVVERTGLLQGDRAAMARMALTAVAKGDEVDLTLPIKEGGLYLGPLKIWQLQ